MQRSKVEQCARGGRTMLFLAREEPLRNDVWMLQ